LKEVGKGKDGKKEGNFTNTVVNAPLQSIPPIFSFLLFL
jgi:hypothetical protein